MHAEPSSGDSEAFVSADICGPPASPPQPTKDSARQLAAVTSTNQLRRPLLSDTTRTLPRGHVQRLVEMRV